MENKEYIEGIYNYCDRWCEKCRFTANCLLYTQESKIKTYEILNKGDISGIEEVFDKEIDRLENETEEDDKSFEGKLGKDYFEEEYENDEDVFDPEDKDILRESPRYPVNDLLDEFFIKSHTLIKTLNSKYNFNADSKEQLSDLSGKKSFDDFEIFVWYHTLIGTKIKRALFSLNDVNNEDDEEIREISAGDMNGSAKVGIISIKRTIDALNNLHKILPVFSAEIEELFVLLGKILNLVDELFPDCMKFKRPGFDV